MFASADCERPDERLTDDCGGKTGVGSSTAGPTDRHEGRGASHFLASFIAAVRKLVVACCNMQLQEV